MFVERRRYSHISNVESKSHLLADLGIKIRDPTSPDGPNVGSSRQPPAKIRHPTGPDGPNVGSSRQPPAKIRHSTEDPPRTANALGDLRETPSLGYISNFSQNSGFFSAHRPAG